MAQDTRNAGPSRDDRVMEALVRIEKKVEILIAIVIFLAVVGIIVGVVLVQDLGAFLVLFVLVPIILLGMLAVGVRFMRRAFGGSGGEEEKEEEINSNPSGRE